MSILQPITFPLTILHGPGHDYSRWDCSAGIREAHAAGATALDVNAQESRTGELVPTHWRFLADHGWRGPAELAHRPVNTLTLEELAKFTSASGHVIRPMHELMAVAAELGVTLCVEAKSGGDFAKLRADAVATGCKVIVMTLPHLGGRNQGYRRLEAAKAAGLPTMILLNTTKFGRGQVPAEEWRHVDYVKGPTIWQKGRPARVVRLGAGSPHGMTVSLRNARKVTARLEKSHPPPKEAGVPASVAQALAHCRSQSAHGPRFGANECKIQCREAYRVPSDGAATAAIAYGRTKFRHPIPANLAGIPDGALLWFTGGEPTAKHPQGAGHVMIKAGATTGWSTDFKRTGFFDLVEVAAVTKRWTKLRLVAWSEDIDGVRVVRDTTPAPAPTPPPVVDRMDPAAYFIGAHGPHVLWLGRQLVAHGFTKFYKVGPGETFTHQDQLAVAAFQRAQGWSGKAADGFPGRITLQRLAAPPGARPGPSAPGWHGTHHAVDYSFARPSPAALKAAGFGLVLRYIARSSRKVLTKGEAAALHAAGLDIALIWETTATRAGQGTAAGRDDVKAAEAVADRLGYAADAVIFYAVDFDATPAQVRAYFAAVRKGAKRPVGIYGGFKVVSAGLAPYVWQTEAWSGGRVYADAHLIQRTRPTLKVKGAAAGWDQNDLLRPFPTWRHK